MTLTTMEMNGLWDRLQKGIPARGFVSFPAGVKGSGPEANWPTSRPVEEFLDIAQRLNVRMVYLSEETLDSSSPLELLGTLLSESDPTLGYDTAEGFFEVVGIASQSVVTEYLAYAKERIGRRAIIHVEWVHESVVHRYTAVADWFGRLMDKATAVADVLEPEGTVPE